MADDKMWKPGMPIPQDEDGKSAGRKIKKTDPGVPEQLGSGIIVDGKPLNDSKPVNTSKPIKKAKGGTASSRADGIATKGKTRGTIIACGGGSMKGMK